MKTYTCFDTPLKVFGIPFFDEKKIRKSARGIEREDHEPGVSGKEMSRCKNRF